MMTKSLMLEDAEVVVIAYGSVARSARSAVLKARDKGIRAGLLQLVTLFPFPKEKVSTALRQCRAALVPEMNLGQISREVNRVNRTSCQVVKLNRVDGQMITPDDIYDALPLK
jgi:2-oxoglutarate ferredoxin oxidoreductase subunit alpha